MRLVFVCLSIFLLFSCSKTQVQEAQTVSADPSILKGNVFLYDEGLNIADPSGMTVSVENSNPVVTTKTDSKGMFSLRVDTSIKSFTLLYSKPLYGDFREYYVREKDTLYQIQQEYQGTRHAKIPIMDGQLFSNPNLGQKSATKVNSLKTVVIDGKLKISCNVSFDGTTVSTNSRFVQLFYQNTPIVSFSDIPKTGKNMSSPIAVINRGDNVVDFCMDCCLKSIAGMKSGDTVYMVAYATSYFSGNYFDMKTGKIEFATMNFSNNVTPISFILP